ncbi:MAG: DsbA family oxidoreductase [Pseudomonadota bacterium]
MIRLDILSDPICPWCYIGKMSLDTALSGRDLNPFQVAWHPFQLNPDMPAEGMDRTAYLEAKFGGPDGAKATYGRIEEAAQAAGLEVRFDLIRRTPNTIDAHRVIRWAGVEGRQGPVVDQLFHRYFVAGQDISDREVLVEIAHSAGLDGDVTRRLLDGDADIADVRAEDARAREMGVTGVPTFLVAGQYALPGAQPPQTWQKVIDELTAPQETPTH